MPSIAVMVVIALVLMVAGRAGQSRGEQVEARGAPASVAPSTTDPPQTATPTTMAPTTSAADGTDRSAPIVLDTATTSSTTPAPSTPASTRRGPASTTAASRSAVTAPDSSTTTTTADPRVFDGVVSITVSPSATSVTLRDRLFYDVVVHNGLTDVVHLPLRACDVLVSTDPMVGPGHMGAWDGTAAGLEHLLDTNWGWEVPDRPSDPASMPTSPPAQNDVVMCAAADIAPGTDLHERFAWDVRLSAVPTTATVYARAGTPYSVGTAGSWKAAASDIVPVQVVDDALRASSRSAAIEAALADPRTPALNPASSYKPYAGAWYHDGWWVVAIYPMDSQSASPLQGWWITVDAATVTVISVQSS